MTQATTRRSIKQKLADISNHFGLGAITSTPRRAMGTNQNYFVTTTTGQYLFKLIVNAVIDFVSCSHRHSKFVHSNRSMLQLPGF